VQQGRLTMEQLTLLQRQIADQGEEALDSKTADEENPKGPAEENETDEDRLMQGVVAASLVELCDELKQVTDLRDLAEKVYQAGTDSKYEKLRDLLTALEYANEKFIVFTEHRDTLTFLVRSLEGMGYTGQVAQIHGGMDYPEREEQVEHFRTPASAGGARFLIATDAAGEGINLQFCWIMINYDIPWNPARLEQRMGRIHRYLQKHDPVVILNLVAPKTREGKVLKTLLDKMEKIRKELSEAKGGYQAPMQIPKATGEVVFAAIAQAIQACQLWLLAPPATLLAEPIPRRPVTQRLRPASVPNRRPSTAPLQKARQAEAVFELPHPVRPRLQQAA
jgi:SNF2 family DNA or RNA helicase